MAFGNMYYHKRRKSVIKRQNEMREQRVADSCLAWKKLIRKEIDQNRGRTTRKLLSIDGYSTSSQMANCFANKYTHLINSVLTNNDDMQMVYNNVCCE